MLILIDSNSGYVWGQAATDDPIEACRIVDAEAREYGHDYEDIGCGPRFDGRDGYFVYRAPEGFDLGDADGQDQAVIEQVEQMPLVTKIVAVRPMD